MEPPFYKGRSHERYKIERLMPGAADRMAIHRIIHDEPVAGMCGLNRA
ncbi:hypothetical protein ACM61V_03165 [Sphingomonas sp. TX0543]|nr:hypothetical protein [Sphingomonas sp. 3P27F8]